jgi:hypothetical protein
VADAWPKPYQTRAGSMTLGDTSLTFQGSVACLCVLEKTCDRHVWGMAGGDGMSRREDGRAATVMEVDPNERPT